MRVLWFCNTPSLFNKNVQGYNGGGWISSLEALISANKDIELGICFFFNGDAQKTVRDNVTYYPLTVYNSKLAKLKHHLFYPQSDQMELEAYLKVIADFSPDIIHVFGTESSFGLVAPHTKIPVVIHIQGILNPYFSVFFPPGTNLSDYFRYYPFVRAIKELRVLKYFRWNTQREVQILKHCKHFMGRTEWDKSITQLFAPNANYYFCNETLRPAFYEAQPWKPKEGKRTVQLVSVISYTNYKGFDVILKAARILKQHTELDFVWHVHGMQAYRFWERKLSIKASEVNIRFMGISSPQQLIESFHSADLFVHPSYVDNSPNSLCEAQLMGVPVLASNVGGIPSLIEDGVSGILFPVTDPHALCSKILSFFSDASMAKTLSENGRKIALERHVVHTIVQRNMEVYSQIINAQKLY